MAFLSCTVCTHCAKCPPPVVQDQLSQRNRATSHTLWHVLVHKNKKLRYTAKSTARPSCLIAVLYDISREKICWWLIYHFYVPRKATEIGEITQTTWPLRRSRSFKVTDFGTNRKPICDFLLVINNNLPPILHRFQVMPDYWSNFR